MSFVIATPETVATAAQNLAAIHSTLNEASAAAAGSTTAVFAGAEDEVSALGRGVVRRRRPGIPSPSANAQMFREQFVIIVERGCRCLPQHRSRECGAGSAERGECARQNAAGPVVDRSWRGRCSRLRRYVRGHWRDGQRRRNRQPVRKPDHQDE